MEKIKVLAIGVKNLINNETAHSLAKFSAILAVAILAPVAFKHQQYITGPIVNATLFIAVAVLGIRGAVLIGLTPSMVALTSGLLPAILAPMVPFIMISNTILVLTFDYLKKKSFWGGAVLASLLKFLFLFSTSSLVINLLIKKELAKNVAAMMSWPQLITSLGGAVIAYLLLKRYIK